MSERRDTSISVGVEKQIPKERRLSEMVVEVEKRLSKNRQASSIVVMVEIGYLIRKRGHAGPRIQMME